MLNSCDQNCYEQVLCNDKRIKLGGLPKGSNKGQSLQVIKGEHP